MCMQSSGVIRAASPWMGTVCSRFGTDASTVLLSRLTEACGPMCCTHWVNVVAGSLVIVAVLYCLLGHPLGHALGHLCKIAEAATVLSVSGLNVRCGPSTLSPTPEGRWQHPGGGSSPYCCLAQPQVAMVVAVSCASRSGTVPSAQSTVNFSGTVTRQ